MSAFDDGFPLMLEREAGMRDDCPQVAVAFGIYPLIDRKASSERAMECYKDVEHIKIAIPGEQKTVVFAPADALYRRRFPQAYAAYQARQKAGEKADGLPLNMWPPISRGMALTLMSGHIVTVQALAAMDEETIAKFPPQVRELHAKAVAFLKMASDTAASMKAEDEKATLLATIQAMQAQINQLQQQETERQAAKEEAAPQPQRATAKAR